MKITIEIPDTSSCLFVNYVFAESTGLSLANKGFGTDELRKGEILNCCPKEEGEAK